MRINLFSRCIPPAFLGGAEISTLHVADQLSSRHDIHWYAPAAEKALPGIHAHKLIRPAGMLEYLPARYATRIQALNQVPRPGLAWCTDFYGTLATAALPGPRIVTVRDFWPICPAELCLTTSNRLCLSCSARALLHCQRLQSTPLLRRLLRAVRFTIYRTHNQRLLQQADHVVFISRFLADMILDRIPLDQWSIIENPLGADYLQPSTAKPTTFSLLFAGALRPDKGLDIVLQAFAQCTQPLPQLQLVIAGRGDINRWQQRAHQLGITANIRFLGPIAPEAMITLYATADIVLAPALRPEPFGRTIIEGMACGCVPIAADHGAPADIIVHGKTGVLVKPNDARDLASAIERTYAEPNHLQNMQHAARQTACTRYEPASIAAHYECLLMQHDT